MIDEKSWLWGAADERMERTGRSPLPFGRIWRRMCTFRGSEDNPNSKMRGTKAGNYRRRRKSDGNARAQAECVRGGAPVGR